MENQTQRIAVVSAFAALYAAMRFIPFSVVIGSPGAFFSFSDFLPLLFGIILGPYLGVLSVVIGTYVSFALARPPIFPEFPLFEFLPAAVNVTVVGFMFLGKRRNSILIFTLVVLLFAVHPLTLNLVPISILGTSLPIPFYWMHLVALLLLFSPLVNRSVKILERTDTRKWTLPRPLTWILFPITALIILIASRIFRRKLDLRLSEFSGVMLSAAILFALIGTMAQHVTGAFLTEISKGNIARVLDPQGFDTLWRIVFFAYPFERSIITAVSALLAVAVLRSLSTTSFIQNLKSRRVDSDSRNK